MDVKFFHQLEFVSKFGLDLSKIIWKFQEL